MDFVTCLIMMLIEAMIFVAVDLYRQCGTMRIDHSNPEKDIYRLDIDSLSKMSKRRYIILRVDNNADLSDNDTQN